MNKTTAQVVLALGLMALSGIACLATHSSDPAWILVVLLFIFF